MDKYEKKKIEKLDPAFMGTNAGSAGASLDEVVLKINEVIDVLNGEPELRESEDERIMDAIEGVIRVYGKTQGEWIGGYDMDTLVVHLREAFGAIEKQKGPNGKDEECTDFTIYHPLKNGKGGYECIPYSFYGSLTSFSKDKDLIDFLRTCFYTKEECNEWIGKQKELPFVKDVVLGYPGLYFYDGERMHFRGSPVKEEKQKELMPPVNVNPCDASCDAYYQRGLNKGYELGLEAGRKEQKPISTEDMPYVADEHFFEREPADSFKYKLAEYMTKNCKKGEGPYGYSYSISAESILQMAKEELIKRGELKEPKPADDKAFEEWIDNWWKHNKVNNPDSYDKGDEIQFDEKGFKNFCRGIRNMYQQKPAWSKKDEKMLNDIIEHLKVAYCACSWLSETLVWLKSLRPQPHWKPSKEQMEAFKIYLYEPQYIDNSEDIKIKLVESLYEDLKKLM